MHLTKQSKEVPALGRSSFLRMDTSLSASSKQTRTSAKGRGERGGKEEFEGSCLGSLGLNMEHIVLPDLNADSSPDQLSSNGTAEALSGLVTDLIR